MVREMRGTPMRPNPNSESDRIPVRIHMPFADMPVPEEIPPLPQEPVKRRMKITAKGLKDHGYTDGCPGCLHSRMGMFARDHTEECRERITEEQEKTGMGRDKKRVAEQRIEQQKKKPEEDVGDGQHPSKDTDMHTATEARK